MVSGIDVSSFKIAHGICTDTVVMVSSIGTFSLQNGVQH